jgi:hypothetical protein
VKGIVLTNCGTLGIDPERVSLSGYIEALNAGDKPDAGPVEVSSGLKRFMAAHGVTGNG